MKNSFILHIDSLCILDKMTDEQAGKFLKAIYHYQKTKELPEMELLLEMAIAPFINQFLRDEKNYEKIVERNKKNGEKGGRKKVVKRTQTTQSNPVGLNPDAASISGEKNDPIVIPENPKNPDAPDNDSGSDNDSDNGNDSKTTKKKGRTKKTETNVLVMPFETETFKAAWAKWLAFKKTEFKFSYKSVLSEQETLNGLAELSGNNEEEAIKIINQSIRNTWQGLFEIKQTRPTTPVVNLHEGKKYPKYDPYDRDNYYTEAEYQAAMEKLKTEKAS